MDTIWQLVDMLVPVAVGMISVPLFTGIKKLVAAIDALHPNIQRLLVVAQVWLLSLAGGALNIVLPENLALFDMSTAEALVASVLAFVIHAARK